MTPPPVTPAALAPATPWVELDRSAWSALAASTPMSLTEDDLARVRGLGERIDLAEVTEV